MAQFVHDSVSKFLTVDRSNEADFFKLANEYFEVMLSWRKSKHNGVLNLRGFERQVFALKTRWTEVDSLMKERGGSGIEDRVWRKFFAVYIAPMRDQLFPDELAVRKLRKSYEVEEPNDIDMNTVENRARDFSELT